MIYEQVHGGDIYRNPDVLDFSTNMNPLGIPGSVVDAAAEGAALSMNYPDVQKAELTTALAAYEQVPQEFFFIGNGAAEVIFAAAWADKPKTALLLAPTFAEYEQALLSVDCDIRYHELRESNDFHVTDEILPEITDELDFLVLCNPNNPTGILMGRVLIERILQRCRQTGTRLLLDECFIDFCDDQSDECIDLLAEYPELMILKAFTKRYAMAGLRLGYGMTGDADFLKRMVQCVQPWNVSIPAQKAGVAALKETQYLEDAREIVSRERSFLKREISNLGFHVLDSQANYIFFRAYEGLDRDLLRKKILIRSCANYRSLDNTWFRIAVRTHEENIKLLEAMKNG